VGKRRPEIDKELGELEREKFVDVSYGVVKNVLRKKKMVREGPLSERKSAAEPFLGRRASEERARKQESEFVAS